LNAVNLQCLAILFMACILVSATAVAGFLNTDFGQVDVSKVSVLDDGLKISGLLYRPRTAGTDNPAPCVVLVHGISEAKQVMSGIGLELARNGFVALAIDAIGHGSSEGQFRYNEDPTLGVLASVRYLESQSFVNASLVGLVGHSLGAGAIRAAALAHGDIRASVFIGGGVGNMATGADYGSLNSTFPKNLLIAIGKYDTLFDLDQLKKEELPPIFETSQEVAIGRTYGSLLAQNARKLVTPSTTHLFEPVDSAVGVEVVDWMSKALKGSEQEVPSTEESKQLLYPYRDAAIIIGLSALVGLIFPISAFLSRFQTEPAPATELEKERSFLGNWKVLAVWGGLGLVLYLPMILVGFVVNVPPMIFGASIAWWMLATGASGLLALLIVAKYTTIKLNIKMAISKAFDRKGAIVAIGLFALIYIVASLVEGLFAFDLGVIAPLLRGLMPAIRILMFLAIVPFFVVYFLVEGLYLHEFREPRPKPTFSADFLSLCKVIGIKVIPYVALLCLQYVPMILLNRLLVPSFAAFLIEFFWLLAPIFTISTACSWWFYRETQKIGTGVVFNSLLFAWIAATVFPL